MNGLPHPSNFNLYISFDLTKLSKTGFGAENERRCQDIIHSSTISKLSQISCQNVVHA